MQMRLITDYATQRVEHNFWKIFTRSCSCMYQPSNCNRATTFGFISQQIFSELSPSKMKRLYYFWQNYSTNWFYNFSRYLKSYLNLNSYYADEKSQQELSRHTIFTVYLIYLCFYRDRTHQKNGNLSSSTKCKTTSDSSIHSYPIFFYLVHANASTFQRNLHLVRISNFTSTTPLTTFLHFHRLANFPSLPCASEQSRGEPQPWNTH